MEGPIFEQLVHAYEETYQVEVREINFSYIYDTTNILIRAIENTAVKTDDGTLSIGKQALRDVLYATENFEGVTGTFTCDSFGDCNTKGFSILRLDDVSAGVDGVLSNIVYPK